MTSKDIRKDAKVIDYENYEKQINDMMKKYLSLQEKLDLAKNALEKYASGNHYIGVTTEGIKPELFEFEENEYGLDEMPIGWLAEQTLMKLEDK